VRYRPVAVMLKRRRRPFFRIASRFSGKAEVSRMEACGLALTAAPMIGLLKAAHGRVCCPDRGIVAKRTGRRPTIERTRTGRARVLARVRRRFESTVYDAEGAGIAVSATVGAAVGSWPCTSPT